MLPPASQPCTSATAVPGLSLELPRRSSQGGAWHLSPLQPPQKNRASVTLLGFRASGRLSTRSPRPETKVGPACVLGDRLAASSQVVPPPQLPEVRPRKKLGWRCPPRPEKHAQHSRPLPEAVEKKEKLWDGPGWRCAWMRWSSELNLEAPFASNEKQQSFWTSALYVFLFSFSMADQWLTENLKVLAQNWFFSALKRFPPRSHLWGAEVGTGVLSALTHGPFWWTHNSLSRFSRGLPTCSALWCLA